jgi:hypothetical protein
MEYSSGLIPHEDQYDDNGFGEAEGNWETKMGLCRGSAATALDDREESLVDFFESLRNSDIPLLVFYRSLSCMRIANLIRYIRVCIYPTVWSFDCVALFLSSCVRGAFRLRHHALLSPHS